MPFLVLTLTHPTFSSTPKGSLAEDVKAMKASATGLGGWCRGPDKTAVPADNMARWDKAENKASSLDARCSPDDKFLGI